MRANKVTDFWSWVNKTPNCWEWCGAVAEGKGQGYGLFRFNKNRYRAHRFSFAIANNIPLTFEGLVLHKCDNPKCVRPSHLELGDHSKNIKDAYARGLRAYGRGPIGESNRHAKLTVKEVIAIKGLISKGLKNTEIGPKFKITYQMVSRIRNNLSWRSVNV